MAEELIIVMGDHPKYGWERKRPIAAVMVPVPEGEVDRPAVEAHADYIRWAFATVHDPDMLRATLYTAGYRLLPRFLTRDANAEGLDQVAQPEMSDDEIRKLVDEASEKYPKK